MTDSIPDTLLLQLSECLSAQTGLHFPSARWPDLQRGISSAAREFEFPDAGSCMHWLLSSPLTRPQIEILASHLTVGETYFFRHKQCFDLLRERILPELIRSRRGAGQRLRIWSAGCCTGEEPYSVAVLLHQMLFDWKEWNIAILGTDINPHYLRRATEGVYKEWSFRATDLSIKERYFTRQGNHCFEILSGPKEMVTFSYLNLAQDTYPSLWNGTNAMDVILCRNVLMYFAPGQAKEVVRGLYRCLVDGGWLIVSPSETSHVLFSEFATVNLPGITLYRKESRGTPDAVPSLLASPSFLFPAPEVEFSLDGNGTGAETCPDSPVRAAPSPPLEEMSAPPASQQNPPQEALRFYQQGRYAEAVEVLVVWLSQDPDDTQAMMLLARAYANQGRLVQALEWCNGVITADKLNPGCHYLLATILQEQGRLPEAVASLKRALYLDQDFTLAHFALGNLRQRQGRSRESRRHFENALRALSRCSQEETVPESEGITAGRLTEIIQSASCLGTRLGG